MINVRSFFNHTHWSWKEFIQLLILVLLFVPIVIETLLKNYLSEVFQNELYAGTLVGLIMSIVFMLGLYFIALKPKRLSWQEVGVRPFPKEYWGHIAIFTIVLIILSVAIVIAMELLFGVGTENTKTVSLQSQMTPLNFLIGFVSAAIISPIYEEIFYRGFLYRFLRVKYGIAAGMISSSFIFMIVHIPTYNTLPINFVSGLIFAWVYEKSGSVLPAIIIHGIVNGLGIILTAVG